MRKWRANNPEYRARQVENERKRKARLAAIKPCPICGGKKKHTATMCIDCRRGENHHAWRGGRVINQGYVLIKAPDEPGAHANGYIPEHRFVMQRHIGRMLRPEETVHHKNGNRLDNRLENLELWSSTHPKGQRVADLVEWAREILDLYGD